MLLTIKKDTPKMGYVLRYNGNPEVVFQITLTTPNQEKNGRKSKRKKKTKSILLYMIFWVVSSGFGLPITKGGMLTNTLPLGYHTVSIADGYHGHGNKKTTPVVAIRNETGHTRLLTGDSTNFIPAPILISDVTDIGGGPVLWLKADAGVTGTTTVTNWADQSGNGNDAAHASAGPALVTDAGNFNPGLSFDAGTSVTGEYLEILNLTLDASVEDLSVFVVFSTVDNTLDQNILDQDNTPNPTFVPMRIQGESTFSRLRNDYGGENTGYSGSDIDNNTTFLAGFTSEQSDDNNTISNQSLYFDGTHGNSTTPTVASVTGKWILSSDLPSKDFDGTIFEVIVYDEVLSDVNRVKVESYLSLKYGLTLSNDNDGDSSTGESLTGFVEGDYLDPLGNKIWNYTAAYHNDIAGIGYDESDFIQLKSKSENTGSIVTLEDTNGGATGGDPTRGYMIWGNDAAVTTATTNDVPTFVFERMTRVWRTEYTSGGLAGVSIEFDLTGLGYDANTVDDFALIVSSSATMASGSLTAATSFSSSILNFDNIDFTAGTTAFFTLSVGYIAPGGVSDGIQVWLKADAGVTGTTLVTNWTDQSGNGLDATHATLGPEFAENPMNFNPALLFDGVVREEITTPLRLNPATDDLSVFLPFIPTNGPNTGNQQASILAQENGTFTATGRPLIQLHSTSGLRNRYQNVTTTFWNDPYAVNELQYLSYSSLQSDNNDNVSSLLLYKDGASNGSYTPTVEDANGSWTVGNNRNRGQPFSGYVPELIVYKEVLSDPKRQKVDSYLALKYGATLDNTGGGTNGDYVDSDGTTYWSATTNSGYHNNVAGIGNDLNSGLTQKQSKSIDAAGLVSIGLDDDALPNGLETSNADNNGSFSVDNSFLVWGNDAASFHAGDNDPALKQIPAGVNSRLNRQWKVQETGTVGTVTVQFDLSSVPNADSEGDIVLLVSNEEDFSSGTATVDIISQSFEMPGDAKVNFRVDFSTGAYFTLGSSVVNALPVTMLSFEGEASENGIRLEWSTSSEINNALFNIERRLASGEFEQIGWVKGSGTSHLIQYYSFEDASPISGANYYRLVDISENGEENHSEVIRVVFDGQKPSPMKIELYPNPVDIGQNLMLNLSGFQGEFHVQIFDSQGKLYWSRLEDATQQVSIPIGKTRAGIYSVICTEPGGRQVQKKIIVKN